MTKLWIVGCQGHIGQALLELLDTTKYELLETDKDDVDITDEAVVNKFMLMNRPDVVINCAGYNAYAVEGELDVDMAYKVNAVGARNLAQAAENVQAKLIQISTDDVFGAVASVPYNEFDDACPAGVYGKSKYAGEKFVSRLVSKYVIIRSSWIYGIGRDFVNVVLNAAKDPNTKTLALAEDMAVPTSAGELAKVIKTFIDEDHYGLYHAVCSGGSCSRIEFANEILKHAGLSDQLTIVKDEAKMPSYSVLDNMMLRITGLSEPADWKGTLEIYMKQTGGEE